MLSGISNDIIFSTKTLKKSDHKLELLLTFHLHYLLYYQFLSIHNKKEKDSLNKIKLQLSKIII